MKTPNFDRVARAYRWMEYVSFGPLLERCRFAQLDHFADPTRALVLGDGDGRFLARLLERHAGVTADVIDLSRVMVRVAMQRVAKHRARANFTIADIRSVSFLDGPAYDLVAAHFFLDCLSDAEVADLLHRLKPSLAPRAVFVISEFAVPSRAPMRWIGRVLVTTLYFAFRLLTGLETRSLPDYSAGMEKAGFHCVEVRRLLGGLLRSERWSLSG